MWSTATYNDVSNFTRPWVSLHFFRCFTLLPNLISLDTLDILGSFSGISSLSLHYIKMKLLILDLGSFFWNKFFIFIHISTSNSSHTRTKINTPSYPATWVDPPQGAKHGSTAGALGPAPLLMVVYRIHIRMKDTRYHGISHTKMEVSGYQTE